MKTSILSPNLSGCVSILDCGVTYLASYVNARTDHTATIWDYTFNRRNWQSYLKEKFETDKPDVIAITYTTLYQRYVEASIKYIRGSLSKDVPIVIGGVHPTLKPEEGFMDGVNAVIIGEGEPAFHELLDATAGGNSYEGIKGLWYKPNGEIIKNAPRGWIKDINELPWPNYDLWDDIDKYLYYLQQLWLVGTRGCPYICTNCEEVQMYRLLPNSGDSPSGIAGTAKRFRFRDPKDYAEEIAWHYDKYKDRGMRMAHPFDPVFPIQRKWTFDFCKAYTDVGLSDKLPVSIFSRADCFYAQAPVKGVFDEERLIALKEAGIKEIRVGIESGSERMRNDIHKKGVTNEQCLTLFELCRKHGVQTIAYNMLGGPTETKAELKETFRFNVKLKPNKPIFFVYQTLTHDLAEMGLVDQDYNIGLAATEQADQWTGDSTRDDTDQGTIQFGEPLASPHFSKNWLIAFQYFCYSYFIAIRVGKGIWRQKHRFFINFGTTMYRGYKEGLNMKIVFAYWLSASGDNLFT